MAEDDQLIDQAEIERLLQQAQPGSRAEPPPKAAAVEPAAKPQNQTQLDSLLGGSKATSAPPTQPAAPAADAGQALAQEDIERLFGETGKGAGPKSEPSQEKANQAVLPGEGEIAQADLEFLLRQAEQALASIDSEPEKMPPGVTRFEFPELAGSPASTEATTLDLIRDVELDLRIELGRTHMYLEDLLKLRKGSVVPLDKLAGDPVDIFVNGRLIARGEVLVLNDNFCVRIAELMAGANVPP